MQSHSSQALLLVSLSVMNPGKQVSYFMASTGALKQAWYFYCQSEYTIIFIANPR